MRWKAIISGLVLASVIAGCKQQCFLPKCTWDRCQELAALPPLECNSDPIPPEHCCMCAPGTVLDPDRPPRYMSLKEAVAIALEHGNVGSQNLNVLFNPGGLGTVTDTLLTFNRPFVTGDDAIRAFALDPAIINADIEAALSRWDVQWTTSMTWIHTDQEVGTPLQTFQATNGVTAIRTDQGTFTSSLLKPLPTGGVAGITFTTDYQNTNLPARVNPAYRPTLQFQFEQPLLQGFGVEINELRSTHPGSILTPFNINSRVESILVTRLRFDEQRAEFERLVNFMLANVELAYWNLYGSYWNLYAQEQGLRFAYAAWAINKARYEAGRIPIQDYAQSRQQYEQFRGQRITALGQVLENERQLRGLLGMPVDDCVRIVPCDEPTLAPYQPDWCTAVNEALALRPELVLARQDLKFRQLDLIAQKNLLLPDLRFFSTYDINGLGNQLDGPAPVNAFQSLASNHFNDWELGLRMQIPLGYRDANSAVRAARLNLARSYIVLRDQEIKTVNFLALQYRHLFEFHEQIQAQRSLRLAAAQQLEARYKEFLAGRGTLDFLLEAQRVWAGALSAEYTAIVQYNQSLVGFEAAKGTLLHYDNVYIAEGPLPQCAQERAVEHHRERTHAVVLRERANPVAHPPCCADPGHENPGLPAIPAEGAPSLPSLFSGNTEPLPPPPSPPGSLPAPQPLHQLPVPRQLEGAVIPNLQEPGRLPAVTSDPGTP
jgi:outer membrane protein TolC